jgi:hypothetical protein
MIQGFSGGLLNRELIYQTDLPSFQRDFASLKTLDHGTGPAITFTRASGATYFDADGVLQTAANDAPRFDHDPVTGESRGLLIEEARTNLVTHSADAANAAWGQVRASITSNAEVAPDGTTTGDKAVENTDTNSHRINCSSVSYVSGTTYTFSIFLKAAERGFAALIMHSANAGNAFGTLPSLFVNLATGEITGASATVTASSAQSVGSGWWRVSISATATSSESNTPAILLATDSPTSSYTGDGTSGLYVWGAQLEAGAFPTSYIPTTSAAATRAADSAVVTPISSFYNQVESTIFSELSATSVAFDSTILAINDTTQNEQIDQRLAITSVTMRARVGGVNQASMAGVSPVVAPVAGTVYKFVAAYKQDDFAASMDGATVVTDTSGNMPTGLSRMVIGSRVATAFLTGHIRKLAYWPKRLSNTLLEQLTT